jgi:mannose-6-phosphate isomerase-like protein (cupin superfamily)
MKRHPALEPFSRDHNVGLILARELMRGDEGVGDKLIAVWKDEMRDHFDMEEELLSPLASEQSVVRLIAEHRAFAEVVAQIESGKDIPVLAKAGALLDAHIRWEEREFFPEIEQTATPTQLAQLAKATDEIENRRADSKWAPRRGELMARRKSTCDSASIAREGLTGPIWAAETEDLDCTLLQWNEGHEIAAHVNDEVDVVMTVLQGAGLIEIDGSKTILKQGVVVVIPKGATRRIQAETTPLLYINVHKRRRRLMPQTERPRR